MNVSQMLFLEMLIGDSRYSDFIMFMDNAERRASYLRIVLLKFENKSSSVSIQEFAEQELTMMSEACIID